MAEGVGEKFAGASRSIPTEPPHSKVAIPSSTTNRSWTKSGRVSKACDNCRDLKTKCSGHRPICQRCKELATHCSYGDRKREKMAKQLDDLTNQIQTYDALLREISPSLDRQTALHVGQIVSEFHNNQPTGPKPLMLSAPGSGMAYPTIASSSDANLPHRVLNCTHNDLNQHGGDIHAMGFIGEHSEIRWLYKLKRLCTQASSPVLKETPDRHSIESVNFFQGTCNTQVIGDLDLSEKPSQSVADRLVDDYFHFVHPAFPIIGKTIFLRQYKSFFTIPFVQPGKRWLAILNMILAIAKRYCRKITGAGEKTLEEGEDGIVYFSRAWKLSMSDVALLDDPDLQQVQVEALTSFYLISVEQINRAWRIGSICIRSAITMGLNLRNEASTVSHVSKETRYRVWWSIYMLDISLSVMTGRPPNTADSYCTTPLPVPFPEENFEDEAVIRLISDIEVRRMLLEGLAAKGPCNAET